MRARSALDEQNRTLESFFLICDLRRARRLNVDAGGAEIMEAVIEANRGLKLMSDGSPPWETCCTVRSGRAGAPSCPDTTSRLSQIALCPENIILAVGALFTVRCAA